MRGAESACERAIGGEVFPFSPSILWGSMAMLEEMI
jgi:hypothetical protein